MKIDLIPTKKAIAVNGLQQVTNPIIFEKGSIPTSDGLLSTDIFGVSVKDRRDTYAFIALNGHFLHPFVYKLLNRMNRNFSSIVHGSKKFTIDDKGNLIEDDEKGKTGLEFLYRNWEKINFEKNNSMMRNERIDVLNAFPKDTLFMENLIVIPAFYRDVNLQSSAGGKISHHEINDKYAKVIRYAGMLTKDNSFDFELHATKGKLQMTLVEIYDILKARIEKKHGLIKKSLLGKSVDYGARSVISAPKFNYNRPEDMYIDFYHTGIPLAQVCATLTPYIVSWVKQFFQREITRLGSRYPIRDKNGEIVYVTLKAPELTFDDNYIKKQIDKFIFSYGERFEPVYLPIDDERFPKGADLTFVGREYIPGVPESESPLSQRPATWCDILFQAAVEVSEDKYAIITRYPLLDYFGMFPSKISVMSTRDTVPMYVGGRLYKYYPNVKLDMSKDEVYTYFIDTISMSNLYLAGLGGDYDGDQVTLKILFSQQANAEAEKIMKSKAHILSTYGKNMRKTTNEAIQTLYATTKFEN